MLCALKMYRLTGQHAVALRSTIKREFWPLCVKCNSVLKANIETFEGRKPISSSSYCMDLVKRRDYDHYLTSLLLPDKIRRMGFALRALNIEISSIRDNVSEATTGKMRVQFWKDTIDNFYNKKNISDGQEKITIPNHPVAIELHKCLINHPNVSRELLDRLINSREVFLTNHQQPFQSMEDVDKYSEYSFSSINSILLESLLDPKKESELNGHAKHCANQLGKAEGIMTILRALPYNSSQRRVYLPLSLLMSHKISSESIIRGSDNEEFRHVIEVIAAVAEDHLTNCRFRKKYLSFEEKLIMLTAVLVDGYLSRLHKAQCNTFDKDLHRKDPWLPFTLYVHKWKKSY